MNKYTFLWSNAHQLFYMRGNIDSYVRYKDIPFNSAEHVFQVSHGSKMTCYLGTADLERQAKEGEKFLDRAFATQYLKDALAQCSNHSAFFGELSKANLEEQSNESLLSLWQKLLDHYSHSVGYFRSTQEEPSRAIIAYIASKVTPEELNTLLLSPDLDEINKEDIAWQRLMAQGFTRPKALEHLKKFTWLFQNSLSYEETLDELEQRAAKPMPRDVGKEKNELHEKQNKILEKYPEIKEQVTTMQELAILRPAVKAAWGSTGFYALPILIEVARRVGEDLHTLAFFYRHEDVELLLRENRKLTEEEVAERKLCTAYVIREGELLAFVGNEAGKIETEELGEKDDTQNIKELKGISARPGQVKGVIRILHVNDPKSTKEFRDSFDKDILVTSMTQPNIVDIAQRASAIITDEGGMLCHAAIISREFGIPCIVGTHKATQILKDGMEVEVDADRGIVKIL